MPRRTKGAAFLFKKWQQEFKIQIIGTYFTRLAISQLSSDLSPKLDLSIEGMRSQQFSEGVFAFLLIGIVVFSAIVIALMFSKNRPEKVRRGERMMFAAIILGIVVAVIFGALQMLGGYLF
jgi:glycerol uptake facilitator-like aquaporin